MTRLSIHLLAATLLFSLAGCEKLGIKLGGDEKPEAPQQPRNGFAVIDLDEIADRLDRDEDLQDALQQRKAQFNNELGQLRSRFMQQVRLKSQEIGEDATEQEQQQLANMIKSLNVQLTRAQNTAQQQLSRDQVTLVQAFRNEVRPVAVKIALERGFTVILTKNEAVLFAYDENFDITEEVIRRMSAPGTSVTPIIP